MPNNVTMTYGNYSFSPVPLITWNKQYDINADGTPVGTTHTITLDGTLTPLPSGTPGYVNVDGLQDDLRSGLANDCQLFEVLCDGNTLIRTVPNVRSIQLNPTTDNWVRTTKYTVELEFYEEAVGSGEDTIFEHQLKSTNETWDLEFDTSRNYYNLDLDGTPDENAYVMRLTHNVSAVGKRHCDWNAVTGAYPVKEAWEQARDWVVGRLGYSTQAFTLIDRDVAYSSSNSGVFNIDPSSFGVYNHVRTQNIDENGGVFGVVETWVITNPTGAGVIAGNALEDFTVTVRSSNSSPFTAVSIEGSIQGLETVDYGTSLGDFTCTESKYDAALSFWNSVQAKLLPRAQLIGNDAATRDINPIPLNSSVGHAPHQGVVTYNIEYDDRPCNFITGALVESITINDNNPSDVFASLTVLGRARGPILQDINTVTAGTRDVNIEVVMQPYSGCSSISAAISASPKTQVETLLCEVEQTLTSAYDQVFKSSDNESWSFKDGRYTRSVSWTYGDCDGDAPVTSFC